MRPPLLVFGWGNPSRGDDALGPLFVERIEAMNLHGRRRILFVDASVAAAAPFVAAPIEAARDESFSTHAMTPQAVLQVYCDLEDDDPPPCWLLAIRGESFELGEAPGAAALRNLDAALAWATQWLATSTAVD